MDTNSHESIGLKDLEIIRVYSCPFVVKETLLAYFFHTSPTPSVNQRDVTTFCCV